MKKALLSGLLISSSVFSFAQITITNADMPTPGDSVRVSYALNTGSVDHTQSGPNYVWDFSTLVPYAQQELRYTQPSAIPFTFIATVSHVNPSPDSLAFIGNVPSNLTDQYKSGNSSFREVGFSFSYAPLGNFSVPVIYANNDYIYRFPLNYTDTDTSDADWTLNAQTFGLFYIGETIHRTNSVDGWGTLITPFDTFQCIRVVSIITTVDTIGTDSVTGFTIPRPIKGEYKWLANGMKIPVLQVETQMMNNAEVVTNVIYQDSLRNTLFQVGIDETTAADKIGLYPNPSNGEFHLNMDLLKPGDVAVRVLDIFGNCVSSTSYPGQPAGPFSAGLNNTSLSSGTYFIEVTVGGQHYVRKAVIIR